MSNFDEPKAIESTIEWRDWFENKKKFWPSSEKVRVTAEQIPHTMGTALVKVKVFRKGQLLWKWVIPYPLPMTEIMIRLQVYLLAKSPKELTPKQRRILIRFCYADPEFKPPVRIYWESGPLTL